MVSEIKTNLLQETKRYFILNLGSKSLESGRYTRGKTSGNSMDQTPQCGLK